MRTQHLWPAIAAVALSSGTAFAQSSRQAETPVTLTGCIQREADFRKTHDLGKGGTLGTGAGRGNEYVLINATRGAAAPGNIDCSFQGAPEAYELTGNRERDLAPYVGRVVQISGTMKEAKTRALPSGEQAPTGGFDPLKKDLRLFEVEVTSFQPPAAATAGGAANQPAAQSAPPSAAPPARTEAQRPAEPPVADTQAPERSESPRQIARSETELPRTASPVPLAGLAGLVSFAGALGLRRLRRR